MTHHDPRLSAWLSAPLSDEAPGVDAVAMNRAIRAYRDWHEARGLERLLVKGATARTTLRCFGPRRRERAMVLAEQLGALVARAA